MRSITPHDRFAALGLLKSLEVEWAIDTRGKPAIELLDHPNHSPIIALRLAAYWDGFPDSYTATQVDAGRALLVACGNGDPIDSHVAAVLALVDKASAA